jgi:hypothetical protein
MLPELKQFQVQKLQREFGTTEKKYQILLFKNLYDLQSCTSITLPYAALLHSNYTVHSIQCVNVINKTLKGT